MPRSAFMESLERNRVDPTGRHWLYVPYDQLTDEIGPLSREAPSDLGILMIESRAKAERRPYHKQKLATILCNMRHFAVEQAQRGVAVHYVCGDETYEEVLRSLLPSLGPIRVMRPAERELRTELQDLYRGGALQEIDHEGWLTSPEQFSRAVGSPPWRMDAFYRLVRQESGLLMDGGKPLGGRFSFDSENRQAWHGEPQAPTPPQFAPDSIDVEVGRLIESEFAAHPGRLDLHAVPSTRQDAAQLWDWGRAFCLPHFGPYEDAMSERSRGLFHSRMSAMLHLHRVLPAHVVRDVLGMEIPLQSKEGFIRQVLGWREFMRHVHEQTDGFRSLPGDAGRAAPTSHAGDAASNQGLPQESSTGPARSGLVGNQPLPPAFWGDATGLRCLDRVVQDVWDEGYSHHITRLMVLSNIATLLDVSPRELTDWFWCAYVDAFDWVVEPNVLGMGTFALGDLFTTKPYVSGTPYIDRMGDSCARCAFDPKRDCPITSLYWAFLQRHRERLESLPRMRMAMRSLERRTRENKRRDSRVFEFVSQALQAGEQLTPERLTKAVDDRV